MKRAEGHYNVSIFPSSLRVSWEPEERIFHPKKVTGPSPNIFGLYNDTADNNNAFITKKHGVTDDNKSYGLLSITSKKKIRDTIDWLVAIAKPKRFYSKKHEKHFKFVINLITLTLSAPQIHSDFEIKSRLLNNILTQLREKFGCKNIFWRAESQMNGNIHFHLATDKFVPWWEIRHTWNKIQNNLGYVDRYTSKYLGMSFEEYLKENPANKNKSVFNRKRAYDAGCESGWADPNSVDVHATKNIRKIRNYIAKVCSQHTSIVGGEVSKNSKGRLYTPLMLVNNELKPCYNPSQQLEHYNKSEKMYRTIGGNMWGRSKFLSRIKAKIHVIYGLVREEIDQIEAFFKSSIFKGDYYHVINVAVNAWASVVKGTLFNSYQMHLLSLQSPDPSQKILFS